MWESIFEDCSLCMSFYTVSMIVFIIHDNASPLLINCQGKVKYSPVRNGLKCILQNLPVINGLNHPFGSMISSKRDESVISECLTR